MSRDDGGDGSKLLLGLLFAASLALGIVAVVGIYQVRSKVDDLERAQQTHDPSDDPSRPHVPDVDEWLAWSNNVRATGANEFASHINRHNVDQLSVQGKIPHVGSGVTSTVTFKNGLGYYTAWDSTFTCFSTETTAVLWQHNLTTLNGAFTTSRSSPAIGVDQSGRELVVITDLGVAYNASYSETSVYAFDRFTGALQWKTVLSNAPQKLATLSPIVWQDRVFWGVSSLEVVVAKFFPSYPCCSDVGEFGAINLGTGEIEWRHEAISPARQAEGWSGAGVWGSTPTVHDGHVFFTTGQSYSRPAAIDTCLATQTPAECLPSDVWIDSVIKVDAYTGTVIDVFQAQGVDTWNLDCLNFGPGLEINSNGNCPYTTAFPDYDFAGPAMVVPLKDGRTGVFAMQKSNVAWMLDADTLQVIWSSLPGGYTGGTLASWGYSYDEERHQILVPSPNYRHRTYEHKGTIYCDGYVSALDAETGKLLWLTPSPDSQTGAQCTAPLQRDPNLDHIPLTHGEDSSLPPIPLPTFFDYANSDSLHGPHGPVRYSTGVVYATATDGNLFAMDARNGKVLYTYNCGSTMYGGVSIDVDRVYVGCGYIKLNADGSPNPIDPFYTADQGAMVVLRL